jgi:hypothetical protein
MHDSRNRTHTDSYSGEAFLFQHLGASSAHHPAKGQHPLPVPGRAAGMSGKLHLSTQLSNPSGTSLHSTIPRARQFSKRSKRRLTKIRTLSFLIFLPGAPWKSMPDSGLRRSSCRNRIREGFGLTVTEVLWKSKPTIAGAVGGIPNQIIHKLTGVLVHSVDGCAYQMRTC